jgi:hypothetical protein
MDEAYKKYPEVMVDVPYTVAVERLIDPSCFGCGSSRISVYDRADTLIMSHERLELKGNRYRLRPEDKIIILKCEDCGRGYYGRFNKIAPFRFDRVN